MRQGIAVSPAGDLLMLVAITLCGLGYAEGARLARRCWANKSAQR
ncbi:MAG TPA: hypothetical protein VFF26_06000 [Gallionella sp.]|nr:hypothetical protein [Gallionella sp.]